MLVSTGLHVHSLVMSHFIFLTPVGRLKVNMGNIYFKQKNFSKAIKYYRMALDQIPNTHKNMRYRVHAAITLTVLYMHYSQILG
jgi:intraflagellar transport protein 88